MCGSQWLFLWHLRDVFARDPLGAQLWEQREGWNWKQDGISACLPLELPMPVCAQRCCLVQPGPALLLQPRQMGRLGVVEMALRGMCLCSECWDEGKERAGARYGHPVLGACAHLHLHQTASWSSLKEDVFSNARTLCIPTRCHQEHSLLTQACVLPAASGDAL